MEHEEIEVDIKFPTLGCDGEPPEWSVVPFIVVGTLFILLTWMIF